VERPAQSLSSYDLSDEGAPSEDLAILGRPAKGLYFRRARVACGRPALHHASCPLLGTREEEGQSLARGFATYDSNTARESRAEADTLGSTESVTSRRFIAPRTFT